MKKTITKTPHIPTQNEIELKLLRMILSNVIQIETKNWESTEHRAFAIGGLEEMIELKQLTNTNKEATDLTTLTADIEKKERENYL